MLWSEPRTYRSHHQDAIVDVGDVVGRFHARLVNVGQQSHLVDTCHREYSAALSHSVTQSQWDPVVLSPISPRSLMCSRSCCMLELRLAGYT